MRAVLDNQVLTIHLEGRVDSDNAAETEREITEAVENAPGASVRLDAEKLEYISSAGLRVLMKLCRRTEKKIPVENVSPEVYEILEMTGFTELLDVRRRLRTISVEGCEMIGEGVTSRVYRLDPETIVKVYRPGVPFEMISAESRKARKAFIAGIPTAIAYDLVRVGDGYGNVYEMLNAKELLQVMISDKARLGENVRRFADMLREIHRIEVDPAEFTPVNEDSRNALAWIESSMGASEITKNMRAILETVPERNTFVHGDCHPGNVMVRDGEMMLIDVTGGGTGHPIFDLMSMYITYRVYARDAEQRSTRIMLKDFTDEEIQLIWDVFISTYLGTEDRELTARAERQIEGYSCARMLLAAAFIPGLLSDGELRFFRQKVTEYGESGPEPLCF